MTRTKIQKLLTEQDKLSRDLADLQPSQHERTKYYFPPIENGIVSVKNRPPLIDAERKAKIDELTTKVARLNKIIEKNWSLVNA